MRPEAARLAQHVQYGRPGVAGAPAGAGEVDREQHQKHQDCSVGAENVHFADKEEVRGGVGGLLALEVGAVLPELALADDAEPRVEEAGVVAAVASPEDDEGKEDEWYRYV